MSNVKGGGGSWTITVAPVSIGPGVVGVYIQGHSFLSVRCITVPTVYTIKIVMVIARAT